MLKTSLASNELQHLDDCFDTCEVDMKRHHTQVIEDLLEMKPTGDVVEGMQAALTSKLLQAPTAAGWFSKKSNKEGAWATWMVMSLARSESRLS